MNIGSYIELALRTEKSVESIGGPEDGRYWAAFEVIVEASHLADLLKKKLIYGKAVEQREIEEQMRIVAAAATGKLDASLPMPLKLSPRLTHAALGGIGEWGELLDALLNDADEVEPMKLSHLVEEVGDTMWYQALALDAINDLGVATPDAVLLANIRKLQARYPERFSLQSSNNRDVAAERAAIEGAL